MSAVRAVRYAAFGPLDQVLRIESVDAPMPRSGELLIRTQYAGINPLDWKLVEGQFRLLAKSRPPCGVGSELAGTVEAVAEGAGFAVGERVVAWLDPFAQPPGALAERVAVPAAQCVRVPEGVSLRDASVLPVAGLSALQLIDQVAAQRGQRVLVHGAAGGIGSFIVPLLRDRGVTVVATGSARSQEFLRTLYPHAQVDYSQPETTWGGPFDAVIDIASSLSAEALARLLPRGGPIAVTLPSFPAMFLDPLLNRLRARQRTTLRLTPTVPQLTQLLQLVAAGRVPVTVSRVFAFEDSVAALVLSRGGRARGKLAVSIG